MGEISSSHSVWFLALSGALKFRGLALAVNPPLPPSLSLIHTHTAWLSLTIATMLALSAWPCCRELEIGPCSSFTNPSLSQSCFGPHLCLDEGWLNSSHWLVAAALTEETRKVRVDVDGRTGWTCVDGCLSLGFIPFNHYSPALKKHCCFRRRRNDLIHVLWIWFYAGYKVYGGGVGGDNIAVWKLAKRCPQALCWACVPRLVSEQ